MVNYNMPIAVELARTSLRVPVLRYATSRPHEEWDNLAAQAGYKLWLVSALSQQMPGHWETYISDKMAWLAMDFSFVPRRDSHRITKVSPPLIHSEFMDDGSTFVVDVGLAGASKFDAMLGIPACGNRIHRIVWGESMQMARAAFAANWRVSLADTSNELDNSSVWLQPEGRKPIAVSSWFSEDPTQQALLHMGVRLCEYTRTMLQHLDDLTQRAGDKVPTIL